jgi:hypothetical protein
VAEAESEAKSRAAKSESLAGTSKSSVAATTENLRRRWLNRGQQPLNGGGERQPRVARGRTIWAGWWAGPPTPSFFLFLFFFFFLLHGAVLLILRLIRRRLARLRRRLGV